MTTIFRISPKARSFGFQGIARLGATLKLGWTMIVTWRERRLAIAHLSAMNEIELKDIGLTPADIPYAVKGKREKRSR